MATYLHFIFTGYSKTIKSHRHKGTGILVNYSDVFLVGYLPTFYDNWIIKNCEKALDTQEQAFRWITHKAPWVATTYILY